MFSTQAEGVNIAFGKMYLYTGNARYPFEQVPTYIHQPMYIRSLQPESLKNPMPKTKNLNEDKKLTGWVDCENRSLFLFQVLHIRVTDSSTETETEMRTEMTV